MFKLCIYNVSNHFSFWIEKRYQIQEPLQEFEVYGELNGNYKFSLIRYNLESLNSELQSPCNKNYCSWLISE